MRDVIVAVAQLAGQLFEVETNTTSAVAAVRDAARDGAELVVLPELFNAGYVDGHEAEFLARYYEAAEVVPGPFVTALLDIAVATGCVVVAGVAERSPDLVGLMYNTAVVLGPGGILGQHRKAHIPREEKHYFAEGTELQVIQTDIGLLGALVCADNSFPESARVLALQGAEILAVPYAAQVPANSEIYRWMAAVRAFENQLFVLAANRTGRQGDLVFAGTSTIAAPDSTVLATMGDEEGVALARLDAGALLAARLRQTRYRDRRPCLYGRLVTEADR